MIGFFVSIFCKVINNNFSKLLCRVTSEQFSLKIVHNFEHIRS